MNSEQMVRAAGPPAVMYGCEVMGVSDSAFLIARRSIASAAAPQAGGKSPDLVLHTLDGASGTLDPAFEAHASPILHWALAFWCSRFSRAQLSRAFTDASLRLSTSKSSWWNIVSGPTSALLASLQRIGWCMPSYREAIDDSGVVWHFDHDSPVAIAAAARDPVRRWRLRRVGDLLPGLIPETCDVGAPDCPEG